MWISAGIVFDIWISNITADILKELLKIGRSLRSVGWLRCLHVVLTSVPGHAILWWVLQRIKQYADSG